MAHKELRRVMITVDADTEIAAKNIIKAVLEAGATAKSATISELSFKEEVLNADLAYTLIKDS